MTVPNATVEIAFTSGYQTAAASRTWTDVTSYVEGQSLIDIARGRPDQFSAPQPSRLSLTLDNTDGRFTPEYVSGAYYPNVKKGRPIRVRVTTAGSGGASPFSGMLGVVGPGSLSPGVGGSGSSGSTFDRDLGYIDEWPVEWPDGSTAMSTVTVSATSRQARNGKSAPLKGIVEAENLDDLPTSYWTLGEPAGTQAAGNIAPGRSETLAVTTSGAGGGLTFGAGVGPTTDDLTAPVFAPTSASIGSRLTAALLSPVTVAGDHVLALEAWFTGATPVSRSCLVILTAGDAERSDGVSAKNPQLAVSLDSTGRVRVEFFNDVTIVASVTSGGGAGNDGLLHHAVGILEISDAGTAKVKLILDGVDIGYSGSGTWPFMSGGAAFFPTFTRLNVGGQRFSNINGDSADLWSGTIAHVAVYRAATAPLSVARFQQHTLAGTTGFTTDASGARISRYARLSGIPTAEVSVEAGLSLSIAHKDTTGEFPIAMMQAVAETEDGVVFDGKDGTLTFHARSHRYNAASAFTLSCAAGDVEGGIKPTLDDQHLTNDVTASRPGGVTIRSTNAASITEYGYYKDTVEILTTSDNEVQSRADWEVNRFGTPRVTIPNLGVDLTSCSASLQASLLAADIGTKFTVTGLPSQAPASTMDFFIEGITEKISPTSYGIEFNVSPAAYANVWQLDSATLSQLDSTTTLAY